MNNTAITWVYKYLVESLLSIFEGCTPRSRTARTYYTHTSEVRVQEAGEGTKGNVSRLQVGPEARGLMGEENGIRCCPQERPGLSPFR